MQKGRPCLGGLLAMGNTMNRRFLDSQFSVQTAIANESRRRILTRTAEVLYCAGFILVISYVIGGMILDVVSRH
jgi:hypothetical protein